MSLFSHKTVITKKQGIYVLLFLICGLLIWFWLVVPRPLISDPYSTVVESKDGQLLGAKIADDGQWRFPLSDSIPEKYKTCLLAFEDHYFYYHPGINPVSLVKAFGRNVKAKKIVSGGSTITMQLSRLARKGKRRNIYNKLVEMVWALNLELRFSKEEILIKYASNAPFGGNVVGLEAASWRYYNRPPTQLSWAESAMLAVLPNAPSLMYPGKQNQQLMTKRNRLLNKLFVSEKIDSITYQLSVVEPVPEKVYVLPSNAYHLVERANQEKKGKRICTTINKSIQYDVVQKVAQHHQLLQANQVHNVAVLVIETQTQNVLAYVGNFSDLNDTEHGYHNDIIQSPRSTGSILKPFLYTAMTDRGMLTPNMLVPDIPSRFGGFTPVNFDQKYDGAVKASEALARSLNIPAVRMLQQFGVEPFYDFLKQAGMNTLSQPAGHYGLSLILGGCEATMWDLGGMYSSMANILVEYEQNDGVYSASPFRKLNWICSDKNHFLENEASQPKLKAASVYQTLSALLNVKRPEDEAGWESFAASRKIAWKTGTSFGFRDAWAVGITHDYTVVVWAGNADGEGRSGLTGVTAAAPLLFEIFGGLPQSGWFMAPSDEMEKVALCHHSGFLPSTFCDRLDTVLLPKGAHVLMCPYHKRIFLDNTEKYRVTSDCESPGNMIVKSWFVLPPVIEYYYRQKTFTIPKPA